MTVWPRCQIDSEYGMRDLTAHSEQISEEEAQRIDALRPYLFSIAYRMVGSASESEDIVQDAFLRFLSGDRDSVESPKAFLSTIVSRLCLDHLKSARVTREQYPGPWLPEPVLTADLASEPEEQAERRDDISLAFLILLERLTPDERAAFVLREAFDFPYNDIADVLGKSSAASRKLVQRARQRLSSEQRRFEAAFADHRRLTERFLAAAGRGDVEALAATLAEDITVWVDGGPDTHAARRPVYGRENNVRFLLGIVRMFPNAGVTLEDVNGEVAILLWDGVTLISVSTIEVIDDRITGMRTMMNPAKIAYLRQRVNPPFTA